MASMDGHASIRLRALVAAVVAASVLLAGAGAGYRALADRLGRIDGGITLAPGTLAAIPMQIASWQGRNVPLDPAVIRATDTDDHLHREYSSASVGRGVVLYVAYGIRLRDLAPHRPEVCYPSAGWTLDSTRVVDVPVVDAAGVTDGTSVPVQIHSFRRGGLQASRLVVLNYYIVGGDYSPDVSLLRSAQWRSRGTGLTYAAQVQIACAATTNAEAAEAAVQEFAATAAPIVHSFLESAVQQAAASPTAGNP